MQSRSKRSAAIKALEKIKSIAKEAEKYDDFGEEIQVESIDNTKDSINYKYVPTEPITAANWSVQATNEARRIAAENAPKDTSSWPKEAEPSKKTPNTLYANPHLSTVDSLYADKKYHSTLKSINVNNVKEYLIAAEKSENRYFAIPELMKYLISNPALMMHHEKFGTTVLNKMIEFETQMVTSNAIGSYEVTEGYRREFLGLVKILKKIAALYGKLKLNDKSFYENITTIAETL
jgi:hypothetical protein